MKSTLGRSRTGAARRRKRLAASVALGAALALAIGAAGCVKANPATDIASSPLVTGPTGPARTLADPMAYIPDIKPIFDSDCIYCHSPSRAYGNYSMTTYAEVMRDVQPGSASSRLVVLTQPRGSMYRYFTGDAQTKSAMVQKWVVTDRAAQTR
jgi:hypothetical protein